MYDATRAVLARNQGLITRAEALDSGLSPGAIRHLLASGALVPVRRGIYADGELWRSLDERRGRPRLRTRAALRAMRRAWVVSHDSAAHEHELDVVVPTRQFVHVTRPGFTNAWTEYGVKHHLARYSTDQVTSVGGLPVLDLARTAVDMAREHGAPYGEIACDAAMARGVPRASLEQAVAPMKSWQYVRRARTAIDLADPGAESPVETLGRLLVLALGVGEPETQFPVLLADGRVVRGDIRVGCHIFECDGRVKYVPEAQGGLATRDVSEVIWEEKKRERLLNQAGLGVSRIVFEDYWYPQRVRALERMSEEYAATVARFGAVLPPALAVQAERLRGRRGA